jgi:hypothetical protein
MKKKIQIFSGLVVLAFLVLFAHGIKAEEGVVKPDLNPTVLSAKIGTSGFEFDLTDTSIGFEPDKNNREMHISGTYQNSGGAVVAVDSANAFQVNLKITKNGTTYLDQTKYSTASATSGLWLWSPTESGIYDVVMTVDVNNAIDESNENNNILTKTINFLSVPSIYTLDLTAPEGEQYQAGQTEQMPIRWNASCGLTTFNLSLYKNGQFVQNMIRDISAGICSGSEVVPYYTTWIIPATLQAGNDYRLKIVSGSVEDDSDVPFTISVATTNAKPDLVVTAVSSATTSVKIGDLITVNNEIKNQGNATTQEGMTNQFYDGVYLSSDTTITTSDYYLGLWLRSALSAGFGANNNTLSFTIPTTVPAGTYYVGVITDYKNIVNESNEDNNSKAGNSISITSATTTTGNTGNTTTTSAGIDLVIEGATIPSSAKIGEELFLSFNIINRGDKDYLWQDHGYAYKSIYSVDYLNSTNGYKTTSRIISDGCKTSVNMVPGGGCGVKMGLIFNEAGAKKIPIMADYASMIPESNENNNNATVYTTIGEVVTTTPTTTIDTYPGYYLKTDKNYYDASEIIKLTIDAVNKSISKYNLNVYGMKSDSSESFLIKSNVEVLNGYKILDIDIDTINGFLAGGDGNYSISICSMKGCAFYSNAMGEISITGLSKKDNSKVMVISPNGGEVYELGEEIKIKWQGGKEIVQIGLVGENARVLNNNFDAGGFISWINVKQNPSGYLVWDGKKVCDLMGSTCQKINSGRYKIIAVSKSTNGNLIIGDGMGGDLGNYDLSDSAFTITSEKDKKEDHDKNEKEEKDKKEKHNEKIKPAVTSNEEQIKQITTSATRLHDNKLDDILSELNQLRNTVKEQASKIKYLESLTKDIKQISEQAIDTINHFITYGVDTNTEKLGAGERAAVMSSFKQAFNKLPETEEELSDAIKIASGRWPSNRNEDAEKKAKEQFKKIYKRIPDMNDSKDNAAVTVMTYGLRQKAENRNLESEKKGIVTFKNIYGHNPKETEDWNIMQAITYSGSARGADSDKDYLTDEREVELGTDPKNKDTDKDGKLDGDEVNSGLDPLKK